MGSVVAIDDWLFIPSFFFFLDENQKPKQQANQHQTHQTTTPSKMRRVQAGPGTNRYEIKKDTGVTAPVSGTSAAQVR